MYGCIYAGIHTHTYTYVHDILHDALVVLFINNFGIRFFGGQLKLVVSLVSLRGVKNYCH